MGVGRIGACSFIWYPATGDPRVGGYPEGRDLIAPAHYARADLDRGPSQALARADCVRPDPVYGRCRIREDGVVTAALLPSVKDPQRHIYSVGLRAEHLLADAQAIAAARPPSLQGVPGARRSHSSVPEPRAVGPDCVPAPLVASRFEGWALLADKYPPWGDLVPAPLLGLNRFSWSAVRRRLEASGEGSSVAAENLLWSLGHPARATSPRIRPVHRSRQLTRRSTSCPTCPSFVTRIGGGGACSLLRSV